MPLMNGKSRMVISKNIKEMIKAGHDPKQAVAASLSHARKMMSEGGMVDYDDDLDAGTNNSQEANRSLAELQAQAVSPGEAIMNPEMESHDDMLARALFKKSQEMDAMEYSEGGLVEGMEDTEMGNKPSMEMMADTDEPMSQMPMKPASMGDSLDKITMDAIMKKKKMRRFG